MGNEYDRTRTGRILDERDILRLEKKIFTPAIKRCDKDGVGNPVYFKKDTTTARGEDGLDYQHSFRSVISNETGFREYSVYQEAAWQVTFDRLSIEERHKIRVQFQQKYIAEGRDMVYLNEDARWQALCHSDDHTKTTLSIISTRHFMFSGTSALKAFEAELCLRVNDKNITLDAHHLDTKADDRVPKDLTIDQVATLDLAGEDFCAVTTEDLPEIINILENLGLVSLEDQKRFV